MQEASAKPLYETEIQERNFHTEIHVNFTSLKLNIPEWRSELNQKRFYCKEKKVKNLEIKKKKSYEPSSEPLSCDVHARKQGRLAPLCCSKG